jgi:hypothetical protein
MLARLPITSNSALHEYRIRKLSPTHIMVLGTYPIGLAILRITVRERLLPMYSVNDDVLAALCLDLVGDAQFPQSLPDTPTRVGLLLAALEISKVAPVELFCIPTPTLVRHSA